jgi:hypothetical protein
MNTYTNLFPMFLICLFLGARNQERPQTDSDTVKKAGAPTITVIKLDISDKTLKMIYEIRNDSEQDIWICEDLNWNLASNFEVYLDEDVQALIIRRRFNVPLIPYRDQPIGRYVRLPTNKSRTESVLIPLPVHRNAFFRAAD